MESRKLATRNRRTPWILLQTGTFLLEDMRTESGWRVFGNLMKGCRFPVEGLMPREETQAVELLEGGAQGMCKGQGVLVGVLDTGVDPLATAMAEGGSLVQIIDTSGAGDIEMVKVEGDDVVQLLSGRTVRKGEEWVDVRVGIKGLFSVYPKVLEKRMRQEEQKKRAEELTKIVSDIVNKDEEDAKESLKFISSMEQVDYLGPVYDFLLFKTSSDSPDWTIGVLPDSSEQLILMSPFGSKTSQLPQIQTFSSQDRLNYSFNVYDKGDILSLVTTSGAHGTHVASIIQGVAPECKLISFKIGDNRLGSMETASSICRALSMAKHLGCDLLNMSYGEASTRFPGKIISVLESIIEKGVMFVTSAGNAGPALTTVGAPGGISLSCVSVGAYVSPSMMEAEYALRSPESSNLASIQYTWSSRGPSPHGGQGVSVTAPGAAIVSVPTFTLCQNMLMNGTSMSSPNACGNLALLLSVLKGEQVQYSPFRVKRALENSAKCIPGVEKSAQGNGLVQIKDCYDLLVSSKDHEYQDASFDITTSLSHSKHGIYIRNKVHKPLIDVVVQITPRFPNPADNQKRINLDLQVALSSSYEWISHAQYVSLMHEGRNFEVQIDTTNLEPGLYEDQIVGIDTESPGSGPLFRIPVTVVIPHPREYLEEPKTLALSPGTISRHFISVPHGASSARITVQALDLESRRQFVLHCVYLADHLSHEKTSFKKYFFARDDSVHTFEMDVQSLVTLEVTLAQFWKSLGESNVTLKVEFLGPVFEQSSVLLSPSDPISRVSLLSTLDREEGKLSASLTDFSTVLNPTENSISAMSPDRDLSPDGLPLYQLFLTYSVSLPEKTKAAPYAQMVCSALYESAFESQFWMIFDSNKQLLVSGDAWPKPQSLPKGNLTIKYRLSHSDVNVLESLRNMQIQVCGSLSSPVTVKVYGNEMEASLASKDTVEKIVIGRGSRKSFHLRLENVSEDVLKKLPKNISSLSGKVVYKSENRKVDIPLICNFSCTPVKKEEKKDSKKTVEFDLQESHCESICKWLSSVPADNFENAFKEFADPILSSKPYLPLLSLRLKHVNSDEGRDRDKLSEIIKASDAVISALDSDEIALKLGRKSSNDKEWKDKKQTLIDALVVKLNAMIDLASLSEEENRDVLSKVFDTLEEWVDLTESQFIHLYMYKNTKLVDSPQYGKVLETAWKIISSEMDHSNRLWDEFIRILKETKWSYIIQLLETNRLLTHPKRFTLF